MFLLVFIFLGIVVTDIPWLAGVFSSMLTFKHSWLSNGVVAVSDLSHIWKKKKDEEVQQLLSLFEKFHIAFPKKQENLWVFPSLLPNERPKNNNNININNKITQERDYEISVLPLGVFGNLIVRLQEWNKVKIVEMWRYVLVPVIILVLVLVLVVLVFILLVLL